MRITIRGDELLLFPEVEATDVRTGESTYLAPQRLPVSNRLRTRLHGLSDLYGRYDAGEIDQSVLVMELIRVADEMAVEHPEWEVEVTFPDDEFEVWRAMVMNVAWKVRTPARRIRREPT